MEWCSLYFPSFVTILISLSHCKRDDHDKASSFLLSFLPTCVVCRYCFFHSLTGKGGWLRILKKYIKNILKNLTLYYLPPKKIFKKFKRFGQFTFGKVLISSLEATQVTEKWKNRITQKPPDFTSGKDGRVKILVKSYISEVNRKGM